MNTKHYWIDKLNYKNRNTSKKNNIHVYIVLHFNLKGYFFFETFIISNLLGNIN